MPMAETKAPVSGQVRGERAGACPQAALGTPPPGVHLSVEWYVPVCSLSWLLVYTVSVHAQSVVRGRTS